MNVAALTGRGLPDPAEDRARPDTISLTFSIVRASEIVEALDDYERLALPQVLQVLRQELITALTRAAS